MSAFHTITRRRMLQTGMATLAGVPLMGAGAMAAGAEANDAIARDAYIWGFPLVMFGRYLDAYKQQGNPLNQFLIQSALSTPSTPGGGPNIDTIYGYSWLDLRDGPQILHVPDVGDRYYSIQLIDMYSNCFAYVGRRATGTKAGAYAILGPGWKGTPPHGVKAIRSPTDDVITFSRTFVMDDADMPAVVAIQNQYAFGGLSDYPHATRYPIAKKEVPLPPILNLAKAGAGYYEELCARLAAAPPAPQDRAALKRFEPIGIGPGLHPPADLKAMLEAAAIAADKQIQTAQYGTLVNGWYVNYSIVGFPTDPLQRASTVKYGPGAHIAEEGLYFNADKGPDGQPLNGARNYVLRFPKGELPPVDAFWSLTAYSPTMSLIENPIRRYAIKGQMPGLVYGNDGSLELQIQHGAPAKGNANWLPAPEGPFRLVLRTYQPKPEILSQAYKLPAITIAS
jgi:hypothetical protein